MTYLNTKTLITRLITLLFFVCLMAASAEGQTSDSLIWLRVDESITDASSGFGFGAGVAISPDGQVFATGNHLVNGDVLTGGLVQVFHDSDFFFSNFASNISGEDVNAQLGGYILLSDDAQRILVQGNTFSSVYDLNPSDSTWSKVGSNILSTKSFVSNSRHGYAVAMSANGDTIAVSEPGYTVTSGTNEGLVRVYTLVDGDWAILGGDFVGQQGDRLGSSLALSADGSSLAIGASIASGETGKIQVYTFDGSSWVQKGSDLLGDGTGFRFGSSVDFTPDGQTLIGGSTMYSETFGEQGSANVYAYDGSDWSQVGSTLLGKGAFYNFGTQVRISDSGKTISVSGESRRITTHPGSVQVFRLFEGQNDWIQLGLDVSGNFGDPNELFGYSLDFSADGETFITSAPNGSDGGRVDLYELIRELDSPIAITPQDGSTIAINFQFDWSVRHLTEVSTVFHLSAQADYSDTLYVQDNLLEGLPMSLIDTLNTGQTYFWRVKQYVTDYPSFESEWNESSFTVAPIEVPTIITPDAAVLEPTFILEWESESEPEDFQFEFHLSSQIDFSDTVLVEENFAGNSITVDLADTLILGDYFWRVRRVAIVDDRKVSDWNAQSFTISIAGIDIISPENASVMEAPVSFLWSSNSQETDDYGYDFQVSSTSDFQDTVLFEIAIPDTTYTINPSDSLLLGVEYYWRARRRAYENATYASDWTQATVSFNVLEATPIFPLNGSSVELPATLAWESLSNDDSGYDFEVQISTFESFADTILYEKNLQDTTLVVDFDFLRATGETYFWRTRRVHSENDMYASAWSEGQSFSTTINTPIIDGLNQDTVELPYFITWLPDTLDTYYDHKLIIYGDQELTDTLATYQVETGVSYPILTYNQEITFRSDSTYYWNLTRYARQNPMLVSETTSSYSFTTIVNNASILSPAMGDTIDPAFTNYYWDESQLEGSLPSYRYEMRISNSSDLSDPLYLKESIFGSSHNLETPIIADTSSLYYWGIRRYAVNNEQLESDFVVDSLVYQVPAPSIGSSADESGVTEVGEEVNLFWGDHGESFFDYYLQISEFKNFSDPIVNQKVVDGFYTLSNLVGNETYYWRVRKVYNQNIADPAYHMSSRWSESSFYVQPDYIQLIPDSIFVDNPNYVNVILHALDQGNGGISVLERDDFDLLENNSPISPTESRYQVSKLDKIPSSLQTVLMLDNSLSIGEDNLVSIKNASRSFIRNKASEQEISIYVFADQVEKVIDFTTDTTSLINAIDNISLTRISGTDLFSATLTGLAAMENEFSLTRIQQSNMLLFTDGKDLAGRATLDSVLTVRGNKQIYAVGAKLNEDDFDEPTLRQIGNAGTFVDTGFGELIPRFTQVQDNLLQFSDSFYWLNYASSRRAGQTDLTVQLKENTNTEENRRIITTFNADGFYSSAIDIVVNGSAENPLGIDTIRMAGDAELKVSIESVFAYAAYPFTFQISDPSRLQINADEEDPFNYYFKADGVEGDTVRLIIADTVQQTLDLEKTLTIIYSARETSFNEAPIIEDQLFTLDENSPNGTQVAIVTASDPESDPIVFSILNGNEGGAFSINESTGELLVATESEIDFELNPTFILTIQVSDSEPKSATAEITIDLIDIFENEAPVFEAQAFDINEHSPVGTIVGQLVAADPENENLVFNIISGNDSQLLALNDSTGLLTLLDSDGLDFEVIQEIVLEVGVSDGFAETIADVTITILDIDESMNQPPFINDQTIEIFTIAQNGDVIGVVSASDPNGDALTYSITAGNDNGIFAIDESTAEIRIQDNSNLVETTYTLTVQASDGELSTTATVTIEVTEQNFAPEVSDQVFTIFETAVNEDEVGTVVAVDVNDDALIYTILSGNSEGIFSLNAADGIITVSNESALAINSYVLIVNVSDGNLSADASVTINVTEVNESPIITSQTFVIDENSSVGTVVGTVSASDPENDPLVFSFASGNEAGSFGIDENSGVISVLNSSALDFESTPSIQVEVQVSDAFSDASATMTINLNDIDDTGQQAPQVSNQTFAVDENSVNGTVVGTVQATDPENNPIFFTIVSGDDSGVFGLGLNDGILTVENSSALDFEITPVFNLSIEASDGDKFNTATITINLNDLDDNKAPLIDNQVFSIDENSPIETVIGTVLATDPEGDALTYSIEAGNTNGAFTIDAFSGSLTVANVSELDFETTPTFVLTVQVADAGASSSAFITVNLNDLDDTNEAPQIANQTLTIDENSTNGTLVGTVSATDPDKDNLTFSIIGGNELSGFTINTNSGELTVATSTALDFEATPVFSLEVEVTDGALSASAIVTINLNDVDENTAPSISDQNFVIDENSASGTVVGTVVATDNEDDAIFFSIVSGNELGGFSIDNAGQLRVVDSSVLDFEVNPIFELEVEATDGDLGSIATITINLNDLNEEEPLNVSRLEQLTVYPNPFKSKLHLNLEKSAFITVSDLSGRIIFQNSYLKGDHEVLLLNAPNAVYHISMRFEDGSYRSHKVIKEE